VLIKEDILMKQLDQPSPNEDYQVNYSNYNRNYNAYNRNAIFNSGKKGAQKNFSPGTRNFYKKNGTQILTIPPPIVKNNQPPILSLPPSQDTSYGCQICDKRGHLARNCLERGNFAAYSMDGADEDTNDEEIQANSVTIQDVD